MVCRKLTGLSSMKSNPVEVLPLERSFSLAWAPFILKHHGEGCKVVPFPDLSKILDIIHRGGAAGGKFFSLVIEENRLHIRF